jgi:dethiobiotin synthetase
VITKSTWFITGTDTGIGKTWCTLALMQYFKQQGFCVAGMKPIATGCYRQQGILRNHDAELILTMSGLEVPYEWVNPYAFEPPLAPHLAATQVGITIDLDHVINNYQQLVNYADVIIIEGIGGWRVWLNSQQTLTDLVLALDVPVILVVGLRLGCINHALLTAEVINNDGCTLTGWIANSVVPQFEPTGSVATLKQRLAVPLLAQLPYSVNANISQLASHLVTDIAKPI